MTYEEFKTQYHTALTSFLGAGMTTMESMELGGILGKLEDDNPAHMAKYEAELDNHLEGKSD